MPCFKGCFVRKSPAQFAEKVGIPLGWCVVSHRLFPDKKTRRQIHGKWVRIRSDSGTIYRVLRFSPNLKSKESEPAELVVDWVGWIDIYGREDDVSSPIELHFQTAPIYVLPLMVNSHPDPTVRIAAQLGLVSVILGILSVILSVT